MADIENRDTFAYDIHKGARRIGEAFDEDAINLSIENILMTNPGERLFLPNFGSPLTAMIFETIDQTNGELLLDAIITAIRDWETRIIILEEQIRMDVRVDENALILVIPYRINRNGLIGTFSRKVIL
jgi:phage baseplate assembly protein W